MLLLRYVMFALGLAAVVYCAWGLVLLEPHVTQWPLNVRLSAVFLWLAAYLIAGVTDWFYRPFDVDKYEVID